MARILVFQHVPHEPLGILDPMLRRRGHRVRYANFGRDPQLRIADSSRYDALVALGGPMNPGTANHPPHLDHEIALIGEFLAADKPVLGICLGCQLLAIAAGGRVHRAAQSEIGWHAVRPTAEAAGDPLFRFLDDAAMVMQWHGMTWSLPAGATLLAEGEAVPHQAFRAGRRAWGLQFHLECDAAMIERWLKLPAHDRDMARPEAQSAAQIRTLTATHLASAMGLGERIFGAFIDLLPGVRRKPVLPSR